MIQITQSYIGQHMRFWYLSYMRKCLILVPMLRYKRLGNLENGFNVLNKSTFSNGNTLSAIGTFKYHFA